MRTIVSGTVNGVAFSLMEDGVTVCQESKYCSMISDGAKASPEKLNKIKEGLYLTAVLDIAYELEDCKDVEFQVSDVAEYTKATTVACYFQVPRNYSKTGF